MTTTSVTSGQTSSGFVVSSGDQLFVLSGATVVSTTVLNNGMAVILSDFVNSADIGVI